MKLVFLSSTIEVGVFTACLRQRINESVIFSNGTLKNVGDLKTPVLKTNKEATYVWTKNTEREIGYYSNLI